MSSFTPSQKATMVTKFLCYIAVCEVYGSGKQCTTAGKEASALTKFTKLAEDFVARKGIFINVNEIALHGLSINDISGTLKPVDSSKRGGPRVFTAFDQTQVWNRGMDARRDLVSLISEFGKGLKLNVLKPVVEEGESSVKSEFSAVLDIASGKGAQDVYDEFQLLVYQSMVKKEKTKTIVSLEPTNDVSAVEVAVPISDVLLDTDELPIIPTSFITLFLMIMKYCVIFADDGKMDGYVLSYLIHAGTEGVSNALIPKLSRSELMARKREETAIKVSTAIGGISNIEGDYKIIQLNYCISQKSITSELQMQTMMKDITPVDQWKEEMEILKNKMKYDQQEFESKTTAYNDAIREHRELQSSGIKKHLIIKDEKIPSTQKKLKPLSFGSSEKENLSPISI